MKIGIAGVGGIGSNVALNLVRSGFKNIKFGDFDEIEKSNLNRQFYFENQIGKFKSDCLKENLFGIDRSINLESCNIRFESDNIKSYFKDCDIIVEGFDGVESKKVFMEAFLNSDKFIVSASGIAGIDSDNIKIKQFGKNCFIVGDFENSIEKNRVYSHKVVIVASKMSEIIIKKVLELNNGKIE